MSEFPIEDLHLVVRTDTRPAYAQIAEQIRRVIRDRRVEPGVQLPSEPELVQRFGVSRMTVREGIRVLRLDDVLRAQHGVGVFVGERRLIGGPQLGGAMTRSEPSWREAVDDALRADPRVEPVAPGIEMWVEGVLQRSRDEASAVHLRIQDLNLRPEVVVLYVPGNESDAVSIARQALEQATSWVVSVRTAGPGDGPRGEGELIVTRVARDERDERPLLAARGLRAGSWAVTTIELQ